MMGIGPSRGKTRVRFTEDARLDLHVPGPRVVVLATYQKGDVVELGEAIAQLYLDWQLAVPYRGVERAVAQRGEQRCRT
jgi:hypothetical protein